MSQIPEGEPDIRSCAVPPLTPPQGAQTGPHVQGERYSRQLRLPELGEEGQRRLAAARVLVIGAGGLGSPALTYLAAAGVGSITVCDADTVDVTNLHRQVLHDDAAIGGSKALSAARQLARIAPEVHVRAVAEPVTTANALDLLAGHHLVLDGADNFPTRYLSSDACEILGIPLVWGSILGFAGQVSVFWGADGRGVTYRDVHPVPPRPGEVPSCAEAGVLGALCGIIGSTMAMEAIKVLAGIGDPLFGRLAVLDALRMRWSQIPIARDPAREPVGELEDLTLTCGLPGPTGPAAGLVEPHELPGLLAAGTRVIDIREAEELAADGALRGAEHVPMGELLQAPDAEQATLEGAVLLCAAGTRSGQAQQVLAARGITVRSLRGGYAAAVAAGAPIDRD